jgi:hypothetical protein
MRSGISAWRERSTGSAKARTKAASRCRLRVARQSRDCGSARLIAAWISGGRAARAGDFQVLDEMIPAY